jgi:rhodanese-related sulfurtransferase
MAATESIPAVIGAARLAALLRERADVRLLDVRTPGEWEGGHIPGAYNVPLDTLGEHASELRAAVHEPVVLICQSGSRARRAEEALKGCSMENVHVLDGGMNGWIAAGGAVNRRRVRMSLERQVRIAAGALVATGSVMALVVSSWWAVLPAFVGSGLVFAGVTDTCGMAMLLAKLPYNRSASCDVDAMVAALKRGDRSGPDGVAVGGTAPVRNCAV